jgi:hypothetical protein
MNTGEIMSDDGLPRGENPPEPTAAKLTCEFCGCALATSGDYFQLSDKAKAFRDQADIADQLRAELSAAQGLAAALERERDDARTELAARTADPPVDVGRKLNLAW